MKYLTLLGDLRNLLEKANRDRLKALDVSNDYHEEMEAAKIKFHEKHQRFQHIETQRNELQSLIRQIEKGELTEEE